jgi:deoxyinosine 3'endonuclease (endonuclease V)
MGDKQAKGPYFVPPRPRVPYFKKYLKWNKFNALEAEMALQAEQAQGEETEETNLKKNKKKALNAAEEFERRYNAMKVRQQEILRNPPMKEEQRRKVTEAEMEMWSIEQNTLKKHLIEENDFDEEQGLDPQDLENTLKLVGAVDISYCKRDDRRAIACLVVCEYPSMNVVYQDYHIVEDLNYPYIPGYLAFKEVPLFETLFDNIEKYRPDLFPQVLLVDGNGILHEREFGSACHLGVQFDIPTIGVAKNAYEVDGITKESIAHVIDGKLHKAGDVGYLVGDSGKVYGAAMKSTTESTKPIFLSIGHRVGLRTAIDIVRLCTRDTRVPEPIRQADLRSRQKVKKRFGQ